MKILICAILAAAAMTGTFAAAATKTADWTTVPISTPFMIEPGTTESITLPARTYVKKLIVQGESYRNDAMVQVLVDGDVKGTIHFPGVDPSYIVTIEAETQTISFQHISGYGRVQIRAVQAVERPARGYRVRTSGGSGGALDPIVYPNRLFEADLTTVAEICARGVDLTNALTPFVTNAEAKQFVLPIKKASARCLAAANGNASNLDKLGQGLSALKQTLEVADGFLSDTFEREEEFSIAVELLTLKERISELLK